jgi:hypothetical protein
LSLQSWDYERADIALVLEAAMSQIQLIIYKPAAPVNSFFTTPFNWRFACISSYLIPNKKRLTNFHVCKPLLLLVGTGRFELPTSTVSG